MTKRPTEDHDLFRTISARTQERARAIEVDIDSEVLPPSAEDQLNALIPSSINDVIRAYRDWVSLRFSTQADLQPLVATVERSTDAVVPVPIAAWLFVTLDIHSPALTQQTVHLCGVDQNLLHSWCTSPVIAIDHTAQLLRTRSGTLYALKGAPGAEQDLDLLRLCAYLHKTPLGGYLGVPPIFY